MDLTRWIQGSAILGVDLTMVCLPEPAQSKVWVGLGILNYLWEKVVDIGIIWASTQWKYLFTQH